MYSFECDFFPDPTRRGDDDEDFDGCFNLLLGSLLKNGQLSSERSNIVDHGDFIRLHALSPAPDGLSEQHFGIYCRDSWRKLLSLSLQSPSIRFVGKVLDQPDCCSCVEPSCYVLCTSRGSIAPPVDCGDCDLPVPMYRLPFVSDEETYEALFSWNRTYQACDRLFGQCFVGERFSYRQMAHLNSDLTKWGREICAEMAQRKGKPFYYYLMLYYATRRRTCPSCGQAWKLREKWHDFYAFKCDQCFLVSNEAYAEATPLSELHP